MIKIILYIFGGFALFIFSWFYSELIKSVGLATIKWWRSDTYSRRWFTEWLDSWIWR